MTPYGLGAKDRMYKCRCGVSPNWLSRYWSGGAVSPDGKKRMTCLSCTATYVFKRLKWRFEGSV